MKKLCTIYLLLVSFFLFPQAPASMSYQAVVRNSSNILLINQSIGVKFTIVKSSSNGIEVYSETQVCKTNSNGLFTTKIGSGNIIQGSFATINWSNDDYFVKTDIDPDGGNTYTISGVQQLLSVPYALSAKNGMASGGTEGQILTKIDDKDYNTKWITPNSNNTGLLTISDFENVAKLTAKSKPFLLNPTRNNFDYRSLIDISLVGGNLDDLKDSSGNWLELYLVFIRVKDSSKSIPNYIVQIAKKNTTNGGVGVGDIMVSNFNSVDDGVLDKNGILTADLVATTDSNLYFNAIIDTKKLAQEDINANLYGTIQLNTAYLARNLINDFEGAANDVLTLGDSITEFGDYPKWIEKTTGNKTYNCGFGGTRIALHANANYDKFSFYQIALAINSGDWSLQDAANQALIALGDNNTDQLNILKGIDFSKIGIITVFFGTNDWTGNNPIGNMSNSNFDTTTVVGAINFGIKKILEKYPHIRFLIITPTHRFFGPNADSSDDYKNENGLNLEDYVKAIVSAANFNHVPVKDLYSESNFNRYNHKNYFTDDVHPNLKGHEVIGQLIGKEINIKF